MSPLVCRNVTVSLPLLVPKETCREVPREVCQQVVVLTRTSPSLETVRYCTTLDTEDLPGQDERRVLELRIPIESERLQRVRGGEKSPALEQRLSPPQLEIQQLRQALALQQQQLAALISPQQQLTPFTSPQQQRQQQLAALISPQQQQPQQLTPFASPQQQQQQQLAALISPQQQQQQVLSPKQQQIPFNNQQLQRVKGFNSQQQKRQQQQQQSNRPKTLNFQRFQKNKKKQENSVKSLSVFSKPKGGRHPKIKKSNAKLQRDEFSRQRALRLLNLH